MSCPQLNSKNNGPGLLFKTILVVAIAKCQPARQKLNTF